jgi:hypothetical protein
MTALRATTAADIARSGFMIVDYGLESAVFSR